MSRYSRNTSGWKKRRIAVLERDGWACGLMLPGRCVGRATTVDHLVPVSLGGDDGMDNLIAACGPCNYAKGDGQRQRRGSPRSWTERSTPAALPGPLPPRGRSQTTATVHYPKATA